MPYKDREKQRLYQGYHYRYNKDKYNASQTRRRDERREFVDDHKLARGCIKCGYKRCAKALVFHHREPDSKDRTISILVRDRVSYERLIVELDKCNVMCANCHRELHVEQRSNGV